MGPGGTPCAGCEFVAGLATKEEVEAQAPKLIAELQASVDVNDNKEEAAQ